MSGCLWSLHACRISLNSMQTQRQKAPGFWWGYWNVFDSVSQTKTEANTSLGLDYAWSFETINNQWWRIISLWVLWGPCLRASAAEGGGMIPGAFRGGFLCCWRREFRSAFSLWKTSQLRRHSARSDCVLNNFNTTNRDPKKWPSIYTSKNYSFPLCSQNVVPWMSRRNVIPKYLMLLGFQLEKKKKKIERKRILSVTMVWIFDAYSFPQKIKSVS